MRPQRARPSCRTPGANIMKTPASSRKQKREHVMDPVKVCCRIRPVPGYNVCFKALSSTVVQLNPPDNSAMSRNGPGREVQYTFSQVFDECADQKLIFNEVALPLVDDLLKGKNGLMFMYGVTSSGKTYTMNGPSKDPGVLPRCFDVLFNSIENVQAKKYVFKSDQLNGYEVQSEADAMLERQQADVLPSRTPSRSGSRSRVDPSEMPSVHDHSRLPLINEDMACTVFVSYVEIYNNYIYDLLEELPHDPITGYRPPQSKILREDGGRNMYVHGVMELEVRSYAEAYELLLRGQRRRKVAHTTLNAESSRSHSVFSLRLVQAPLDDRAEEVIQNKDSILTSQLSLVDLAGSERTKRTDNAGDRLKEASQINQSLMTLRSCIEVLRENQKTGSKKLVPYRDSKLTHLFKNYFDGEGKVHMVVCVNPRVEECDETLQVMRFAEVTQEVQVARASERHITPFRKRRAPEPPTPDPIRPDIGASPMLPSASMAVTFPKLPRIEELDVFDPVNLRRIISTLEDAAKIRASLRDDYQRQRVELRQGIELERSSLSSRVNEYDSVMHEEKEEKRRLKRRVTELESVTAQMRDENKRLRSEVHQLRSQAANSKRLELEYNATVGAQENKFRLLRNVINKDGEGTPRNSSVMRPPPPPRTPGTRYRTGSNSSNSSAGGTPRVAPAKSEPDLSHLGNRPKRIGSGSQTPRRAAPPVAPKPTGRPASNHRHRRSKSSNDIWLEHRPKGVVQTGTVLQPVLRKKRSVSKLDVKDVQKGDKYILTHQESVGDGSVATQLYKGNIIPSAGGGASIVFDDVETLGQQEPGDKRRSSPRQPALPPASDQDWTDVETRCSVAIEGHPSGRAKNRSKVSHV